MNRVPRIAAWMALGGVLLMLPAQAPNQPMLLDTPFAPAGYERLLREYVAVAPFAEGGEETSFDYARFWSRADQAKVRDRVRRRFLEADPEEMDLPTRRAWAINAYNFFVIDLVVEHLGNPEAPRLESIRDLGKKPFAVFDDEQFLVHGTRYSLNRFESHFLFEDFDRKSGKKPPPELDPRIHFALVCAARGCPPLAVKPYEPARLNAQLDEAVRAALRSPRHLRLDGDTLHLSQIFAWYAEDFGLDGVRAFVARYAPEAPARALTAAKPPAIRADIPWDWSLNDRE